jgi:hypothetical protein
MNLQKILICGGVALAAFTVSLGLLEAGRFPGAEIAPNDSQSEPSPSRSPAHGEFRQMRGAGSGENTAEFIKSGENDDGRYNGAEVYRMIGRLPKGFEDFESLSIIPGNNRTKLVTVGVIPVKPQGMVSTLAKNKFSCADFKFSWANITGRRISFVTEIIGGVSYQFDGRFVEAEKILVKDSGRESHIEYVLLKGRLTKWGKRVKLAESRVKFASGKDYD